MIRRFLGFIDRNAPSWDSFLLIHLSSADEGGVYLLHAFPG